MRLILSSLLSSLFIGALPLTSCVAPPEETTLPEDSSLSTQQSELKRTRSYRVTVQNVTAGNGLSPPLVVAHGRTHHLFSVGAAASPGIAEVAETGGTHQLESELKNQDDVIAVVKAEGGPIPAGQSRVINVTIPASIIAHGARLNLVAMIGRSNDSFVSFSEAVDLRSINETGKAFPLANFDSGTEENTGNVEDFGAGGHPVVRAEGIISYDRGLNPRGNAPEVTAWGSIAGVVRIERTE